MLSQVWLWSRLWLSREGRKLEAGTSALRHFSEKKRQPKVANAWQSTIQDRSHAATGYRTISQVPLHQAILHNNQPSCKDESAKSPTTTSSPTARWTPTTHATRLQFQRAYHTTSNARSLCIDRAQRRPAYWARSPGRCARSVNQRQPPSWN